jgi:hypothetical protein
MVTITAKIREQISPADNPNSLFVMRLLHARTTSHLKHWLTPSRSDHIALEFFYTGIVDLLDSYVEASQSVHGKIEPMDGYIYALDEPLAYFEELGNFIDVCRYTAGFPQESWLQNQVDEIRKLVAQTVYQLRDLA